MPEEEFKQNFETSLPKLVEFQINAVFKIPILRDTAIIKRFFEIQKHLKPSIQEDFRRGRASINPQMSPGRSSILNNPFLADSAR